MIINYAGFKDCGTVCCGEKRVTVQKNNRISVKERV